MISKTAEYALRAIVWLAREPERMLSADQLAQPTQVPRRYLHKVLQDLAHAHLIRSQPGPGGGYSLEKPPQEISILDVVNAVDPIERIRHCPLGLRSHTQLCPLHKQLDQTYAATEKALGGVTIAQLLSSSSRVAPLCEAK